MRDSAQPHPVQPSTPFEMCFPQDTPLLHTPVSVTAETPCSGGVMGRDLSPSALLVSGGLSLV